MVVRFSKGSGRVLADFAKPFVTFLFSSVLQRTRWMQFNRV